MSQEQLNASAKLGIIGAGAMGSAIASGLVETGTLAAQQIFICDHNANKLSALSEKTGIVSCADASEVFAASPTIVLLAIKPQVLPAFLSANASVLAGKLVISIAAGVSVASLEAALPGARIVRVMPNLPVALRSGASAICSGSSASEQDVAVAQTLFSALGCAQVMREDQLDAEGAVVGCGPAYFALFIDALTRAGVKAGLPAASAREMSIATMKGVALMLESGEVHPREFMEKVTSPGGTTAAALYELEPALTKGVYDAVDAALERTKQLAKG